MDSWALMSPQGGVVAVSAMAAFSLWSELWEVVQAQAVVDGPLRGKTGDAGGLCWWEDQQQRAL